MRRLILTVPVLSMACVVGAYNPDKDTDVGSTDVTNTDDEDTDVAGDTDRDTAEDTYLTPTDDGENDTDGVGADYGCHNYDPVEGVGWVRKYDLRTSGGRGVEKQTGLGYQTMPSTPSAQFSDGYGYEVVITGIPALNSTSTYYNRCNVSRDEGAFEVGFTQPNTSNRQPAVAATFPLKAGAIVARKYLPDELSMSSAFGASQWHVSMKYDMKVPSYKVVPTQGWAYDSAKLTYDGDVVPFGFETINIPALGGNITAYHVNYTYVMEQKAGPTGFFDIFNQLFSAFGSIFGFQGDDQSVSAIADQWYVRGIGLVKEEVYRYPASAQELIREKTLTSCQGLPQCP